ncbi:MAG: M3 family oligoendopeptidase [Candidatus Woesearchaeota archaeon]|nr:M3 family oligoendopeptidase [Candidatus Woesearchaeota archaeon]
MWQTDKLSADPQASLHELKEKTTAFETWRAKLTDISSDDFKQLVQEYSELMDLLSRISAYAKLNVDANTKDDDARALLSTVQQVVSETHNKMRFFTHWWKDLDDVTQLLPVLQENQYVFEHMRALREHTLSEEVENVISLKNTTGTAALNSIYGIVDSRLVYEFAGEELVDEQIRAKFSDPDPTVRKNAYDTFYKTRKPERDVFAEIYKNIVLNWENERKLRGYSSAINIRNKANDLPDAVVEQHLAACREAAPLWQRYFALKEKILGRKLTRYDVYAPLADVEQEYTYDDALQLTLDAFKGFSPKLHEAAVEIYEGGFVDELPRKNKRGGAFCWGVTRELPPFLMYNFTGKLRDVSTIAHETGHGVHHQLCRQLPVLSCDHALPIAETASVFAEMLLTEKLMRDDPSLKQMLLAQKLDDMYATIGRQSFFVLFEQEAHELFVAGKTTDDVSAAYMQNLKEQFGEMEIPAQFKDEWLGIPHFFNWPFYCYSYSFGNLLTLALYQKYREEGEAFVPKYEAFLAAGETKSPIDLCNEIGVDISTKEFWKSGFALIEEMLTELEALVE